MIKTLKDILRCDIIKKKYKGVYNMKFTKLMAIITICACFVGCADKQKKEEQTKISDVSQKIIDDISSIGDVELSDKELIEKIEKNYLNCTEEQKNQINNYATLLEARDTLDILIKEENDRILAETKEKERLEAEKQKVYTDDVKFCASGLIAIRETLKDPESMIINDFCLLSSDKYRYLCADISGKNGFGGVARSCYAATHDSQYVDFGTFHRDTFMFIIDGEMVNVDTSRVSYYSGSDNVDNEKVLELYNEFLETKEYSIATDHLFY